MKKKKIKYSYSNKNSINYIAIILVCVTSILSGFFIAKLCLPTSKLTSLEKSNIENETILNEKRSELTKLQESLAKKTSSIENLEEEILNLNAKIEESNSEVYYIEGE